MCTENIEKQDQNSSEAEMQSSQSSQVRSTTNAPRRTSPSASRKDNDDVMKIQPLQNSPLVLRKTRDDAIKTQTLTTSTSGQLEVGDRQKSSCPEVRLFIRDPNIGINVERIATLNAEIEMVEQQLQQQQHEQSDDHLAQQFDVEQAFGTVNREASLASRQETNESSNGVPDEETLGSITFCRVIVIIITIILSTVSFLFLYFALQKTRGIND